MTADPALAHETTRLLRHVPVLALSEPALLGVVRAGVRRAGGQSNLLVISAGDPDALSSIAAGAHEVVIALCEVSGTAALIRAVRERGGRPIPVLLLGGEATSPIVSAASRSLLADPSLVDLEIAVPTVEDDEVRRVLWDQLRDIRAEERHHLVEVDGRPALEELDVAQPSDAWASLGAGAAGVLAGRLAAANRRWRAQLDA